MTAQTNDLFHAKRGLAALVACMVQTLNESDPTFQERFLANLRKAYSEFSDHTEGDTIQELELLSGIMEYLTGFSVTKGQGQPFAED
jgi:hypothetical protein